MAIRPGSYRKYDPDPRTMDPESARRLSSGFWKHSYSMETQEEIWTCDKPKLHEAVQRLCLDHRVSRKFLNDPVTFLDARFGEGTAEAYRHSGQARVAMRFNAEGREDMAYFTNSNTFSGTTTSGDSTWVYPTNKPRKKEDTYTKLPSSAKKLVRNTPFVSAGKGLLLQTLQKDFDFWARNQMEIVRG